MKLKFPDSRIPRFFFLEHLENCQNWLPEGTVLAIKNTRELIVKLKHGSTTISYIYQENHRTSFNMLGFPLSELDSSLLIHYQQENHYNQLRETSDAFCWSGSWWCPGAFSIFQHFSLSSRWCDKTFHLPQFGVLDVLDCNSDFVVENRIPIIPIHLGMVAPNQFWLDSEEFYNWWTWVYKTMAYIGFVWQNLADHMGVPHYHGRYVAEELKKIVWYMRGKI
jgi:hypothetical protein